MPDNTPKKESTSKNVTEDVIKNEEIKNEDDESPASSEPVAGSAPDSHLIKTVLALAVVLVMGIVGLVVLGNNAREDVAENQTPISTNTQTTSLGASLAIIEGVVEWSDDGEAWEAATVDTAVSEGDYVRTLKDSRAVLLLDDGNIARLNQGTTIQLNKIDASTTEVYLVSGQLYARVIESDDREFTAFTANDRYVALGTAFRVIAETDERLEVYHSKVKVVSADLEIGEGNGFDAENKKSESLDLDKLELDEFVKWNKTQDMENKEFKDKLGVLEFAPDEKEDPAEPPSSSNPTVAPGIEASASTTDKGVKLQWSVVGGLNVADGYKVVYDAKDATPTYGENSAHYVSAGAKSHFIELQDGKTYYFRVCAYRPASGSCTGYSSVVVAKAPKVEKESVVSGAVTLAIDGPSVQWTIGGTAPHGFKLLLSTSPEPIYPNHSIQYIGASDRSATLPTKPAGTYYVRLCKYTADPAVGGGCTDYSNQVEYIVAP